MTKQKAFKAKFGELLDVSAVGCVLVSRSGSTFFCQALVQDLILLFGWDKYFIKSSRDTHKNTLVVMRTSSKWNKYVHYLEVTYTDRAVALDLWKWCITCALTLGKWCPKVHDRVHLWTIDSCIWAKKVLHLLRSDFTSLYYVTYGYFLKNFFSSFILF